MVCAQCGAVVTDGQENCAKCGTQIARQTAIGAGDEVDRLLAEANLLRIRKQQDEAIGLCTRVLRLDPANATAHSLMGDIYRDEGNHREALGWYKLAVQLDPTNQADRKKLDDMIDRVFNDVQQGDGEDAASLISEPAAAPSRKNTISAYLEKITPTHVIIGSVVLAVIVVCILLIPNNSNKGQQRAERPTTRYSDSRRLGDDPRQSTSTTSPTTTPTGQLPQVVPPGPDTVEGSTKLPGLPIIVQHDTPKSNTPLTPANNATRQPVPNPGVAGGNAAGEHVAQVPPFQPQQRNRMSSDDLERETEQLRAAINSSLKDAKLPFTLSELLLDPRTRTAVIGYNIPHMQGPVETKQGLLYAGFYLVWQAQKADISLRKFTLRGYAYPSSGKDDIPSLALQADVSPQQADDASEMGDYQSVAKCMSDVWWRGDLSNVTP